MDFLLCVPSGATGVQREKVTSNVRNLEKLTRLQENMQSTKIYSQASSISHAHGRTLERQRAREAEAAAVADYEDKRAIPKKAKTKGERLVAQRSSTTQTEQPCRA
eukprot:115359-Amphidinium_carterae.1